VNSGADFISQRSLLLFTKPAHPGRVKTRLVGALSEAQTAKIHAAFVSDLTERLQGGRYHFQIAWAVSEEEDFPIGLVIGGGENVRQASGNLGDRLYRGLAAAAEHSELVAAIGSDHPELRPETVEEAFQQLEEGADAVFGPTADGGYYLVGLRRSAVCPEVFDGIAWSTETVFGESLKRCHHLGLTVAQLPAGHDIDVPEDLDALACRLRAAPRTCPRTRSLLAAWGYPETASP